MQQCCKGPRSPLLALLSYLENFFKSNSQDRPIAMQPGKSVSGYNAGSYLYRYEAHFFFWRSSARPVGSDQVSRQADGCSSTDRSTAAVPYQSITQPACPGQLPPGPELFHTPSKAQRQHPGPRPFRPGLRPGTTGGGSSQPAALPHGQVRG